MMCTVCSKPMTDPTFFKSIDHKAGRYIPMYFAVDKSPKDIIAVFCGATCSLAWHEAKRNNDVVDHKA